MDPTDPDPVQHFFPVLLGNGVNKFIILLTKEREPGSWKRSVAGRTVTSARDSKPDPGCVRKRTLSGRLLLPLPPPSRLAFRKESNRAGVSESAPNQWMRILKRFIK
jgi:hypothetical protein